MVIWFNVKKAREFLLKNGHVYTLRPKKRREGVEVLSYEGFGKKGVVYVSFVRAIENDEELKEFIGESGFESVKEWRKEAGESRFLYYVFVIGGK
jgi:reverse gyrase